MGKQGCLISSLKGGEWPRLCRGQREAFSRLDVDHFGLAPTRSNQGLDREKVLK